MNLQMERIQQACDSLKLSSLVTEWSTIADNAAGKESSLADFLESLLNVEVDTIKADIH